ncbi:MspA family porin [Gordonia crocea]|uniref:Porin MspD n=1 Tax=Gordonia crocea TaxID=589162 RepID=A0A7I9UZF8_9ACTN|nr:MspA family porin [Gordonia crocea]GED98558.1 porin MspD [Gordonia crocea]
MTSMGRRSRGALSVAAAVMAAGMLVAGPAQARVEGGDSVVDGKKRKIAALVSDTRVESVVPIDSNPTSRQWRYSGKSTLRITGGDEDEDGAKVEDWGGTVTFGFLIGYPATLTGSIGVSYSTPNITWWVPLEPSQQEIRGPYINWNMLPTVTGNLAVGFGPGVRAVDATTGQAKGAGGVLRVKNFHGAVTGVLGQVTIQPYIRVWSNEGDTIMVYGRKHLL